MTGDPVVVLTVHGIGAPPRALDPGEHRTWVSVEQFEQALDAVVGRPDVRLTFDDGNASDVDIALPRLVERGLTAHFFLLAGRLGEHGRVDADGVRELVDAGMSIGSHGWAHRDWRRLDPSEVHDEIVEAPRRLASVAGRPVTTAAVPFGSYDRTVLTRLRAAGTERVYTSDGGPTTPDRWLQSRTSLREDTAVDDVRGLFERTPLARRVHRAAVTWVKRHR